MANRFKIILLVRFLGYLLFFTSLLVLMILLMPLVTAEINYKIDQVLGVKRTVATANRDSFANIKPSENQIVPVSTDFGIVIEKINANAKIIANVNASDEKAYVAALSEGVAEALGSTPPGQPGNLYLFSHSTNAPLNIIRYNAVFFLLGKLEKGDRIVIFYKNKRYDYLVYDKTIARSTDVSYLTNRYSEPVLTLQTCDPPGTLINRLIVRAKLVSI